MSTAESAARDPQTRAAALLSAWQGHRGQVAQAARAAGRDPASITTIVVTKKFPRSDVDHLIAHGIRDIGENTDQEARGKLLEPALTAPVKRHFIGQLQSNKAASVLAWAELIHSVDRPKLVTALARASERLDRPAQILIQVNADEPGASARGGLAPDQVAGLAQLAQEAGLLVRGLMMVAPPAVDPGPSFAALAHASEELRAVIPSASIISAGMSGDFGQAIAHGATHLRVGGAILGNRYHAP